jgi:hypothetical protein
MAMQQPNPASNSNLLALPEGTELVGDYRIQRVLGPAASASPISPTRQALARVVTIKEYFPADYAAAGTPAKPRHARKVAPRTTSGGSSASSRRRARSRASFTPTSCASTGTSSPTTPATWSWSSRRAELQGVAEGLKRAPRQPSSTDLAPLLDALEIVHKGDYLHRDIAPDNIIIRKDGSPVLIDFGSARGEIASHSKTVSALVKPGYSPYEQYATTSSKQGPWTDIYALGATLYHACRASARPMRPRAWSTTSTSRPAMPRSAPTVRLSWRQSTRRSGSRSASGRSPSPNGARRCWPRSPSGMAGLSLARALQRLRTGDGQAESGTEPAEGRRAAE